MPLSHASFGDMFAVSTPGITQFKGQPPQGSSRIVLAAQGSKIDAHHRPVQRTSHNARGRR
jgi:hypothetical protein